MTAGVTAYVWRQSSTRRAPLVLMLACEQSQGRRTVGMGIEVLLPDWVCASLGR